MQQPRAQDVASQEIDLFDTVEFFARHKLKILACGLAGAVLAAAYSQVMPPVYEASIIVKMAQAPIASTNSSAVAIADVEEAALLLERLKNPGAYTEKSVKACAPDGVKLFPEDMAALLKVSLVKVPSSVVIRVQRNSSELAARCLDAVFEMLREQQAEQKRQRDMMVKDALSALRSNLKEYQNSIKSIVKSDQATAVLVMVELARFFQQVNQMENLLSMGAATRLISPARPQFKSRTGILIAGGGALGVMLGLVWGFLSELQRKWRAGRVAAA